MGRPREFEIEEAIETASRLFWERGYDGTAVSDLTAAIGVSAPSFYFAFGSKEELFRKVVERYLAAHQKLVESACAEATSRAVAHRVLAGYVDVLTDPAHAPGCLALNSALPCAAGAPVRKWLADHREGLRFKLKARFARARQSGDLLPDADPNALARLVVAVAWGMAVEAQSGASRSQLRKTVEAAISGWPDGKR